MDKANRIKLAQYHHRRGMRLVKCGRHVEMSTHQQAFFELARASFEARDYCLDRARGLL